MSGPTPGYKGKFYVSGVSTSFTGEATTNTTGNEYQVNTATRRVLDPSVARVWKDGGSAIDAANIVSEDLLFGKVVLASPPGGAVTLDASYLPRALVAYVKSVKGTIKADALDVTDLHADGYRKRILGQIDFSGSVELFDDLQTDLYTDGDNTPEFQAFLMTRVPKLLEIDPDGTGTGVLRAWVVFDSEEMMLDPAQVMTSTINFMLASQSTTTVNASVAWGAE